MADRVIRESYAACCRRRLAAQKVKASGFSVRRRRAEQENPRSTVSFLFTILIAWGRSSLSLTNKLITFVTRLITGNG